MKTKRIVIAAVMCLFIEQLAVYAGNADETNKAETDLKAEISAIVHKAPFELVTRYFDENKVLISLRVNEQGEVELISVTGRNDDLINWVENNLRRSSIKADPSLYGVKYTIPVHYEMTL